MTAPLVSTTDRPYQLLPPLTVEQRDLLRQSIKENGVLEPVVFDEDGEILDGHHRVEIAEELGIEYPRRVIDDLDRPGKHMYALTVNVARRQLDQNARGSLVAQMRIRGMSIRSIAEALGVSRGTVANDVAQLSKSGQLRQPERITGADGKERPATRPAPKSVETPGPVEPPSADPDPDLTSAIERALTSAGQAGMTAWQLAFLIDPAGPDAARAELAVRMAPVLEQLAAERRARVVGEVDGGLLWAFAHPSWPTEAELKPWETFAPEADRLAESMEPIDYDPRDRTHGAEFESYDRAESSLVPAPIAAHYETSAWKGDEPGECGIECACGTTYDGFDSLAEAAEYLARHIELSNRNTQTPEPVTAPTVPVAGSGPTFPEPEPERHLSVVPEQPRSALAVTPEQRQQIVDDAERTRSINHARKIADRLVSEVSGFITEIEQGLAYGEPGLVTAEMVAGLREQADRLERYLKEKA